MLLNMAFSFFTIFKRFIKKKLGKLTNLNILYKVCMQKYYEIFKMRLGPTLQTIQIKYKINNSN